MTELVGHHVLKNRYCFEGTLRLESALRISSGVTGPDTDAPFIRTAGDLVYIPGSSLRGAIRSELERVLPVLGDRWKLAGSCTLFTQNDCNDKLRQWRRDLGHDPSDDEVYTYCGKNLCPICRLFGAAGYASRIRFHDGLPKTGKNPPTRVRDGVGIDRDTGAAREKVKYDYEVIEKSPQSPEFTFLVTVENVADGTSDRQLINLVLHLLKAGICIGGKKCAGLGVISLAPDYKVTGFDSVDTLLASLENDALGAVSWEEVL